MMWKLAVFANGATESHPAPDGRTGRLLHDQPAEVARLIEEFFG
jgi:hypothetical protein